MTRAAGITIVPEASDAELPDLDPGRTDSGLTVCIAPSLSHCL